jgi:hypothetical protein
METPIQLIEFYSRNNEERHLCFFSGRLVAFLKTFLENQQVVVHRKLGNSNVVFQSGSQKLQCLESCDGLHQQPRPTPTDFNLSFVMNEIWFHDNFGFKFGIIDFVMRKVLLDDGTEKVVVQIVCHNQICCAKFCAVVNNDGTLTDLDCIDQFTDTEDLIRQSYNYRHLYRFLGKTVETNDVRISFSLNHKPSFCRILNHDGLCLYMSPITTQ